MKLSHFHIGVTDLSHTTAWFKDILGLTPSFQSDDMIVVSFDGIDIAIHQGNEDTALTIAVKCADCFQSYNDALARGAKGRTPPKDKGEAIGADVFGPGKIILEFEQTK